jgi:multimeric flavodoxin WrbA
MVGMDACTDLLVLLGSARRQGNTDLLVERALAGARDGGATAERVRLYDLEMRPCCGCFHCREGRCRARTDDVQAVLDRMVGARALLFATPVYFWNVSGMMKNLWDRMLPLAGLDLSARPVTMSPLLRGRRAGTIVVQEEPEGPHQSIIRLFFERNFADFGMTHVGDVYAYGALRKGDIAADEAALQAAYDLGAALVR